METENNLKQLIEDFIKSLESETTIPKEIADAFTARLMSKKPNLGKSTTTPASETITILGSDAAKPMTGFITLTLNGVQYNIPYY